MFINFITLFYLFEDAFKYLGDNVEGLAEVGAHNSEIDFLQDVLTDFNLLSLVKVKNI